MTDGFLLIPDRCFPFFNDLFFFLPHASPLWGSLAQTGLSRSLGERLGSQYFRDGGQALTELLWQPDHHAGQRWLPVPADGRETLRKVHSCLSTYFQNKQYFLDRGEIIVSGSFLNSSHVCCGGIWEDSSWWRFLHWLIINNCSQPP